MMLRGARREGAGRVVENEPVHVFEIEAQHAARSVDLKEMLIAMADAEACRLRTCRRFH